MDTTGMSRPRAAALRVAAVCTLLLVAGLSACTAGFFYNRIDWAVAWYVNGLVSLDDNQEAQLRDSVRRDMAWHRRTQLPRYIAVLDEMAGEASKPVTADRLEVRYQQFAGFLDDFLRQVTPEAALILRTLTPTQVDELVKNLEEDNQDLWEEYAGDTPDKRQKRRVKTGLRVLQRFTGRLNDQQRDLVEARLSGMHDVSNQWLERRRHWQRRFFQLIRSPPAGPLFESALLDLAVNPNQFDTGDYRRRVDENRRLILEMVAELSTSLTPQQREHLRRKFQGYADDLRAIAASE